MARAEVGSCYNASFHHIARIEKMCHDASVKLVYLPPYSPDLNLIEEFFAELELAEL
jgi:transposase